MSGVQIAIDIDIDIAIDIAIVNKNKTSGLSLEVLFFVPNQLNNRLNIGQYSFQVELKQK